MQALFPDRRDHSWAGDTPDLSPDTGNQKPVFQYVAVNQEIDLNRDSKVSADFVDYLGVKADKLGLRKPEDEKLLLCIPSDAKHPEEGKKFIEYISE